MSTLAFLSIIVGAIFFVFILMHYWKYKEYNKPEMDSIINAQDEELNRRDEDIDGYEMWSGSPWKEWTYENAGSHTHSIPQLRVPIQHQVPVEPMERAEPISPSTSPSAQVEISPPREMTANAINARRGGVAPDEAIERRNNVSNITTTVSGSASMHIEPLTLFYRNGRMVMINEFGEIDIGPVPGPGAQLEFGPEPTEEKKKEVIVEEPHKLKRKMDI